MISRFFIDRPIFAAVLSIVITLGGGIALRALPMAQYPEITPPSVQVAITYPGASSLVVADTVAAPIEQQVNGVEGMLYLSSQSGNDGSYTLTVTFKLGTDLNTALVMVQNRVTLAMPQLPTAVQLQGINIRKKTPDILNVVTLYSPDGRYDDLYLSNYATIYLKDELLRVDGVSDINYLGQRDYSIRAWLDPQALAARSITANEVVAAISSQNIEAVAGRLGQPPLAPRSGLAFELPIDTLGRLSTPDQFGDIIIKVGQGPSRSQATQQAPASSASSSTISSSTTPTAGGTVGAQSLSGGTLSNTTSDSGSSGTSSSGSNGTSTGPGETSNGTLANSGSGPATSSTSSGSGNTGSGSSGNGNSNPSANSNPSGSGNSGNSGNTNSTGIAGSSTLSGGLLGGGVLTSNALGGGPIASGTTGTAVRGLPAGLAPRIVRLRDVARVEMGAQNYNIVCTLDGKPCVGLAIHQLPGTNALDVADRVRQKMEELKANFPEGIAYTTPYDTTPFIRESVTDVVYTLLEAVVLVGVVVLVFLQNWRAALIPLLAVPVAIVGTFTVMYALGFSLNTISLFGLVLAIGIVVDDAIVVVENVERWLEQGLAPREAAIKGMDEVTGPVIAVALVLCAVFVPCAFISGITGQFFRQFAVTIAASTLFSAFNSLTLSPALAALLLKPRGARRDPLTWLLDVSLGWFFRLFNAGFDFATRGYAQTVRWSLRLCLLVLVVYGVLLALTGWVFHQAPTGFVPDQDQGRLIASIELPDSASLQRTQEVIAEIEEIADHTPGVAHTATVSGLSFVLSTNSSNFGSMFIILDPSDKRRTRDRSAFAIMAHLQKEYSQKIKGARVMVLNAPPIPGLSVAGGFKVMVEDRGGLGVRFLQQETDKLVGELRHDPGLSAVNSAFHSDTPMLYMDVDRTKVQSLGVSVGDVDQAMQVYMGSVYVNSFNAFGRYWQVTAQSDGVFRTRPEQVNLIEVRNNAGQMVPLGTLMTLRPVSGPVMVQRYNLFVAAPITGNVRPGESSGQAIANVQEDARSLPLSIGTEWTELMFMQIRAGNTAIYVFLLAVVFVFLALAALYESWSLPLAVILVVPLCLLCSLTGVLLAHKAVDIFVQIGLVVLVGLACKNAILIVEFAQHLRQQGRPALEATVEASRLRLRPILMTSFAFILGVLPLVIATGAGAEMRQSLGVAVFSGMLGVTLFGIFLTPVFFYVIQRVGEAPLFTSATVRWVGSPVAGGLLGLAVGWLLARLCELNLIESAGGGAALGAVLALLLPAFWPHVRLWPRPADRVRPAGPDRAPPGGPSR